MNINKNTLLNSLLTKIDPMIKSKIEKLSINGKVDLSSLTKDKGIQTLLSELFKEMATGIKGKSEVATLLENSKNSLKFKNISSDLKQIVNTLKTEVKQTSQLEKLTTLLKNSIVDIKNIDEKVLKNSIQNSGIFLESKLAQSNKSVSQNLKSMITILNEKVVILNSTDPDISVKIEKSFLTLNKKINFIKEQLENIKSDNTTEIKKEIKSLDSKIETLKDIKNTESKTTLVKEIIQQTTKVIGKIDTLNIKELLKNDIGNLKNISGDIKTILLQVKEQIESSTYKEIASKEFRAHIDKVLSQIDYYQLSSFSSNSSNAFISFIQDDIDDVDIKFNNANDDEFSCLINLSLKENGELKILLKLDKNNGLNIDIGTKNNAFKNMIQSSLQKLRIQINSIGLPLLSLNVFDLEDELKKSNELKAYENNHNLDFGLDIKV
jgi:hypothetical protein